MYILLHFSNCFSRLCEVLVIRPKTHPIRGHFKKIYTQSDHQDFETFQKKNMSLRDQEPIIFSEFPSVAFRHEKSVIFKRFSEFFDSLFKLFLSIV